MAKKKPNEPIPGDCMPQCRTCAFAELAKDGKGFCRRYPPVFAADAESSGFVLPSIIADEWCGEYKRHLNG